MSFLGSIARLFVVFPDPAIPEVESRASIENPGTPINGDTLGAVYWKSKSGAAIDVKSIISLPAFWRAVKIVSGVIASLPIEVVTEKADGVEEVDRKHPVYQLLSYYPSELYTKYKFIETMIAHIMAYGNFYAVINFDNLTSRPKSMDIVSMPDKVTIERNKRGGIVYVIDGQTRIAYDRMLHISNLSMDGICGLNMPEIHVDNYGLAVSNRDYGNTFYSNGAHLSGALKHPGKLTQEAYNRLRSSWESRNSGAENAGKTAILEEGMDYVRIGLAPGDAQFGETKKLSIADIALITGVPRFLLEESDPTFNNGETLTRQFTNYTILPFCENIESEFNRKLFMTYEMGKTRTRFNLNQLLRADTEQRGRFIDNLMKWGIINRDEARHMEGWNPIADGSGAKYLVPLNMVDPSQPEDGNSETDENEQENEQQ